MDNQVVVEADFIRETGGRIRYQMMVLEGEMVILNVGLTLEVNRCHSQ